MNRNVIGLAVMLIVLPALAQETVAKWGRCEGSTFDSLVAFTPDQRIDYCTQFIKSGNLTPAQLAEIYVIRARWYDVKDLRDAALSDLNEAVSLNPDFAKAYYVRGGIFGVMMRDDLALDDYKKAIALRPDFTDAYFAIGGYYRAKAIVDQISGDHARSFSEDNEAVIYFTKALSIKQEVGILDARAKTYEHMGQPDNAIADYRTALKRIINSGTSVVVQEFKDDFVVSVRLREFLLLH